MNLFPSRAQARAIIAGATAFTKWAANGSSTHASRLLIAAQFTTASAESSATRRSTATPSIKSTSPRTQDDTSQPPSRNPCTALLPTRPAAPNINTFFMSILASFLLPHISCIRSTACAEKQYKPNPRRPPVQTPRIAPEIQALSGSRNPHFILAIPLLLPILPAHCPCPGSRSIQT